VGAHTALVTPFLNGAVAWDDLKKLVEFQIQQGIDGLVAVGTTGESPTLDYDEHIEVIRKTSSPPAASRSWPARAPTPRPKPST